MQTTYAKVEPEFDTVSLSIRKGSLRYSCTYPGCLTFSDGAYFKLNGMPIRDEDVPSDVWNYAKNVCNTLLNRS